MNKNQKFIGIVFCYDGAELFNKGTSGSIWPQAYFIVNFPPELRTKPHIGLHLAVLNKGNKYSLQLIIDELKQLWNIGITYNSII